jgi:lipopolysaccharide export system permease protein
MKSTLRWYLSGLFLQRFAVTLFALVTLLSVLDALSNTDILPVDSGFAGQMQYMWLRLPMLFDRALLFGFLLAVLLTYISLFRRNELVAIAASGISVFGQLRLLLPVVFAAGLIAALLINVASPPASRALQAWLGTKALQDSEKTPQKLWLSDETRLVELESIKGDELSGVTIFKRDESGLVVSVTTAESAIAAPGGWRLINAVQRRFDGQATEDQSFWPSPQTPSNLQNLMLPPRDMGFSTLLSLSELRDSGSKPSGAYLMWALNRVFLPVTAIGLMILGVSMMQVYGRRANADLAAAAAVAIGFLFMVIDGILKTLAENGGLNPLLTILIPNTALLAGGIWLALERETRR